MKKFNITTLFLFAFVGLKAQDPFFTLFRQNNLWLNPASAGMEDKHVFSLSGMNQWDDGNENTAVLTYDQPLKKINSGIGALGWYEQDGPPLTRTYFAGLCYDYQIKFTDKMKLSIGVEAAFAHQLTHVSYNYDPLQTQSGIPGPVSPSDTTIIHENYTAITNYLDFNAGVWYKWSDFYFGFSVDHIVSPSVGEQYLFDQVVRKVVITSGYTWKFSQHFSMIPSIQYFHQGYETDLLELNNELCLNNTYMVGGGIFASNETIPFAICGGVNWKDKIQLMLSYAYAKYPYESLKVYETNIKYRF